MVWKIYDLSTQCAKQMMQSAPTEHFLTANSDKTVWSNLDCFLSEANNHKISHASAVTSGFVSFCFQYRLLLNWYTRQ